MKPEDSLIFRQMLFVFNNKPTVRGFIDIVRFCGEKEEGWVDIPDMNGCSISSGYIQDDDISELCSFISNCETIRRNRGFLKDRQSKYAASKQIIDTIKSEVSVQDECKADGRLWPMVDAYILDEPLRSLVGGDRNPLEDTAQVLRTYFSSKQNAVKVRVPDILWSRLAAFLQACEAERELRFDLDLLREAINAKLGKKIDTTYAYMNFVWVGEDVANTFLGCLDPQSCNEQVTLIRLFILLFDWGKPGYSLFRNGDFKRNDLRGRLDSICSNSHHNIEDRIEGLLGKDVYKGWRLLDSVVNRSRYLTKTLDIENVMRVMPRPLDGDDEDDPLGVAIYDGLAERIADLIVRLAGEWPASTESLWMLVSDLWQQYDVLADGEARSVAIMAGLMSVGQSVTGLFEEDFDKRLAAGMRAATRLKHDGWVQASRDFIGLQIALYSLFEEELSIDARRMVSRQFCRDQKLIESPLMTAALSAIAQWDNDSISALWARQFSGMGKSRPSLSLIRTAKSGSDREGVERRLAGDLGGRSIWLRYHDETRKMLVEAEYSWSRDAHEIGRDRDWRSLAGAFFLPIEHELRKRFAFIVDDNDMLEECRSKGVKIQGQKLTAGPIIFAIKKIDSLPRIRARAEADGMVIPELFDVMKDLSGVLQIRNQAFHAENISAKKLVDMRTKLYNHGLLKRLALCFPEHR